MASNQEIRNENQAFLESLKDNKGRVYQLIRTMGRFHRYDVQAQLSITQHAPAYASAYATEAIWNRLGRSVPEGTQGIEIDTGAEEPVVIYEVSNTTGPRQDLIWRFDKRDTAIFDGLAPENGSVPAKIAELCRNGMEDERAASIATAVILTRLGYNFRNVVDVNSIDFETLEIEDLTKALADANTFSRGVLDNIADYVRKGKDVEHGREVNSYLRTLVRTQAEVLGRGESDSDSRVAGERDLGGLSDERGRGVQPETSADSGRPDEEVERAGVRETGDESDGLAGQDELSEDGSQRDDDTGSVQPVEESEPEISLEAMRDAVLDKVAFLDSDIVNVRIVSMYQMAANDNSPFQAEALKQLRLAYAADEAELRLAHENFIDSLRDYVLDKASVLDSPNTNQHIAEIFERSKNENNRQDIALTEDLIPSTDEELCDFSNSYLDYLITEDLGEGPDIERRKQEKKDLDRESGLSMDSSVREFFRLRHPSDEVANDIPEELTFRDVVSQLNSGRDLYSIVGVSDSAIRQSIVRQIESMDASYTYTQLFELDMENYVNGPQEDSPAPTQEETREEGIAPDSSDTSAQDESITGEEGVSASDEAAEETEANQDTPSSTQETTVSQEDSTAEQVDTIASIDAEEAAFLESWQDPAFESEGLTGSTPVVATYFNYKGLYLKNYQDYKDGSIRDFRPYIEDSKRQARYLGDYMHNPVASAALMEFTEKIEEFYNRRLAVMGIQAEEATLEPPTSTAEAGRSEASEVGNAPQAQEAAVVRYKYYLNHRPADLGSVPSNFESLDENDPKGRYGAIYYTRPLSSKEIRDYEITPELDRVVHDWRAAWQDPDFDSLGVSEEDVREYRKAISKIDLGFNNYTRPDEEFKVYVEKALEDANISNQEIMFTAVRYGYSLRDFNARRAEYNRVVAEYEATGVAIPFSANKTVIEAPTPEPTETAQETNTDTQLETQAEVPAESETQTAAIEENINSPSETQQEAEAISSDRAEEIRAALASDANANTKEAFRKNLLAIEVMKELEASGRTATEDEIPLMRSYVGFGGLREQVFREGGYPGWENEQQELKNALTEAEYEALRASTLTAFYTPPEVVEAIYKTLDNIGFKHGNILDPSMGSGRFFDNMPENMRKDSNLIGVEIDSLTGRMAKFAYPEADVSVMGFEKTRYPDNSFDLAITNVPFGDYSVYDTTEKGTFKIHDYFIAKMIEQVRPGGLVAAVTSSGTMDKANRSARLDFATKAELLGAVRLPKDAFKGSGTQVGTDILLFRKREREITLEEAQAERWVMTDNMTPSMHDEQRQMHVNTYFNSQSETVLGKMQPVSTKFGFTMACVPDDNPAPLGERIVEAMSHIQERYKPSEEPMPYPVQTVAVDSSDSYSFYIDDENRLMFTTPTGDSEPKLTKAQDAKIRALLPLRNQVRALIDLEKDSTVSDAMVAEEIKQLNEAYDRYFAQYGSIALDKDLKKGFHDDVAYPLMCSIEKIRFDAERGNVYDGKGDIFNGRILVPHQEPDHADTALDALSISMLEHGKVDLPYMSTLTGQSEKQLLRQLENLHIYYDDEQEAYVHVDEYLSGDIRGKMEFIDNTIAALKDEIERYATEKVLPDKTARFVPRNEDEENIVYDPYRYMSTNDGNRLNEEEARQKANAYIEAHLDDKAFAAVALAYTENHGYDFTDRILARYGGDVNFIIDAIQHGYRVPLSHYKMEAVGLVHYEALRQATQTKVYAKHYDEKYLYNFYKEKLAEYQGREEDLMHLKRFQLNDEFEEWIEAKDNEIKTYAENHLDDERIKPLMDRINLLEQKKADLDKVKPIDVLADEINVGLGTTWIPPKYIEAFLKDTFDLGWYVGDDINVLYSPHAGTWQITGKSRDYGPLVSNTYGLKDKINALTLVEQALNMKTPVIYETVVVDGEEKRVANDKDTQLAQQKQDIIKEEFKKWLFKDNERKNAIVAYYNRHFNSIVPRKYNGEGLTFPGMNPSIELREHQKNAIAHTLYGGNALFAHAVGAGKTFEMVASAMESKRLGLANKSMIVVPNHLTEQMGTEFKQLYPDANVLVATANDFKKDNRKAFAAKIATYNWDAVIMGFSQFERIPMSQGYMEHSLNAQINELINARMEVINTGRKGSDQVRFSVRQIESMKKKLEARLEKLRNSPKDNVVRFEDLGIDRLYVDEAHEFKNLFTYTKMANVAGVSTTDAQKTTDLYEKVRYLNNKTGEKGVIFATGTPVSNSMTELYTMMRYLEPAKLKEMGINSFDAWASTFGETTTGFELRPEGKGFQRKTRFAKFNNLPELMSLYQQVADIKTQDMLDLDVPEAEYIVEKLQTSDEQKAILDKLVERAELIHKGQPASIMRSDGEMSDDNFLWITLDAKKLALDQRLVNPMLPDDPNSKVNKCVENVVNVYKETNDRLGTQLIFCDMSTPKGDGSFNVYDDIKQKLIEKGLKESEVAFIHDAKNEEQKAKLFSKVRSGEVRVLLGSTAKMGTGTNVQDLLVASHDLDVPWRPADLEQRAGRTIRQGNKNKKVKIFRYVTEGTFDSYLWQTLENKQRFISQIMTSKSPLRTVEDCDETTLNYAEIKAIAIGNPLIKEKLDNDNEVSRLMLSKAEFLDSRKALQIEATKTLPASIKNYEEYFEKISADVEHVKQNATMVEGQEVFKIKLNDKIFSDRKEAGEYIEKAMKDGSYKTLKGEYKGMNLSLIVSHDVSNLGAYQIVVSHRDSYCVDLGSDPSGNMLRLEHRLQRLPDTMEKVKENLEAKKHTLKTTLEEINRPWPMQEKLDAALKRGKELDELLIEQTENNKEEDVTLEKKSAQVACR